MYGDQIIIDKKRSLVAQTKLELTNTYYTVEKKKDVHSARHLMALFGCVKFQEKCKSNVLKLLSRHKQLTVCAKGCYLKLNNAELGLLNSAHLLPYGHW